MVVHDHRKPGWIFYAAWVVLSAVSFPIALSIGWALLALAIKIAGDTIQVNGQTHITEDFLLLYIFFPMLGLVSGLLQYLLLRRCLPRMGWWIAATALGWLLPTWFLGLFAFYGAPLPPALAIVLFGGCITLLQWLVLRQRVYGAAWWILAVVLGWAATFLITGPVISSWPDGLAVLLLPAILTSMAWWLLLDRLPQQRRSALL